MHNSDKAIAEKDFFKNIKAAFTKAFGSIAKANKVEASTLFMLLHSTALKYTAGKYFRPGMVFALLY